MEELVPMIWEIIGAGIKRVDATHIACVIDSGCDLIITTDDERLIYRNPFDLKYKVRADYEQFLRCFYREKADTVYMPVVVADYEGGGFSDKNKKISEKERREIIQMYLPAAQIRKYDLLRALTLAPLRTALSSGRLTAGAYNAIKDAVYSVKRRKK